MSKAKTRTPLKGVQVPLPITDLPIAELESSTLRFDKPVLEEGDLARTADDIGIVTKVGRKLIQLNHSGHVERSKASLIRTQVLKWEDPLFCLVGESWEEQVNLLFRDRWIFNLSGYQVMQVEKDLLAEYRGWKLEAYRVGGELREIDLSKNKGGWFIEVKRIEGDPLEYCQRAIDFVEQCLDQLAQLLAEAETPLPPLLKWAGSKTWLAPVLAKLFQPYSADHIWVEPFCGALGASLGVMPELALLGDSNEHLINLYKWIKSGLNLRACGVDMTADSDTYYSNRDAFNELIKTRPSTAAAAAYFYYLNRVCWRGLCRFNKSGVFNVPFGGYKRPKLDHGFSRYRRELERWQFVHADFETLVDQARGLSCFVYLDPPYDCPFTSYSKGGFRWADQLRLAQWAARLKCPVVISNQATPRIIQLYESLGFKIRILEAPRSISASSDRAPAYEILATKNLDDEEGVTPPELSNKALPSVGDTIQTRSGEAVVTHVVSMGQGQEPCIFADYGSGTPQPHLRWEVEQGPALRVHDRVIRPQLKNVDGSDILGSVVAIKPTLMKSILIRWDNYDAEISYTPEDISRIGIERSRIYKARELAEDPDLNQFVQPIAESLESLKIQRRELMQRLDAVRKSGEVAPAGAEFDSYQQKRTNKDGSTVIFPSPEESYWKVKHKDPIFQHNGKMVRSLHLGTASNPRKKDWDARMQRRREIRRLESLLDRVERKMQQLTK